MKSMTIQASNLLKEDNEGKGYSDGINLTILMSTDKNSVQKLSVTVKEFVRVGESQLPEGAIKHVVTHHCDNIKGAVSLFCSLYEHYLNVGYCMGWWFTSKNMPFTTWEGR